MKDDQVTIILGRIEDKLARFAEAMADVPPKITEIEARLDNIETDLEAVKALGRAHSHELDDHETRLTHLEAA